MFLEYLENDGKRYFNLSNEPLLVEVSVNSGEVLRCTKTSGTFGQVGLYTKIFYYNNNILLVPMHADRFILFDIKSGSMDAIEIPQKDIARENYGFFIKAVQKGQFIYAFGINYSGIVKIDMENKIAELIVDFRKIGLREKLLRGMACIGENVYTAIENSCKIACFNTGTEQFSILDIDIPDASFIDALCSNDLGVWIVADSGMIYNYSVVNGTLEKLSNYIDYLGNKLSILHSIYWGEKIFLFPSSSNRVHWFDCELKSWRSIEVSIEDSSNGLCFYYITVKNQELSFWCESNNQFYTFNEQKQIFEKSNKQINESEYTRFMMNREDVQTIKECESLSLKSYLDYLIDD